MSLVNSVSEFNWKGVWKITWNFAISILGGICVRFGMIEDEFAELRSELLCELPIPSEDPEQTESRLETADEQDSDSKPKKREEIGFFNDGGCCWVKRVGRLAGGGTSENRQLPDSGMLLPTPGGMFSLMTDVGCWKADENGGIGRCGFGGIPGLFWGVLSAELEHDPDPAPIPRSFSICKRPMTESGKRYLGGDASWSLSQKRRSCDVDNCDVSWSLSNKRRDEDVTFDELSVFSDVLSQKCHKYVTTITNDL